MRAGFSLVELSIVLVILGLLTGGILSGQSLIRAAEVRSVAEDIKRYQTAMTLFKDRYLSLAGDMKTATRFWGVLAGTGDDATCQNTYATGLPTCNGTGDGKMQWNAVSYGESFRAWQHLANAGLIEGSYTGRDGAAVPGDAMGSGFRMPGVNIPQGKIARSYFFLAWRDRQSGNVDQFDNPAGHLMTYGDRVLRPEEAWNIDTKLDDGKPAYGFALAPKRDNTFNPNCTTGNDSSAEYNVTNTAQLCPMYFYIGL